MIFRFQAIEVGELGAGPGLRLYRRPVVPVRLFGPVASALIRMTLDTGAVTSLLPMRVAAQIGIPRFPFRSRVHGVGMLAEGAEVFYASVVLRLSQGREVCQWRAAVGFTQAPLAGHPGLLGLAGGLEHFHTTFDSFADQITLIPRLTLPVTESTVP